MATPVPKKLLHFLKGENGEQRLTRFWSKVRMGAVDECWEWQAGTNTYGYGRFKMANYVVTASNRVALIAHTMEEPEGMHALHHCDNPKCCNPEHLYWGTHADNMRDKLERGRQRSGDQSGAKNGHAKINEKQLELIVTRLQEGWNNKQIAADLPITHSMVSLIRLGKMWTKQTAALGYVPRSRNRRTKVAS